MGVCLYGLGQTGKVRVANRTANPYGEVVHIFPLAYRHKYYRTGFLEDNNEVAINRAKRTADKVLNDPCYQLLAFVGKKASEGLDVYELNSDSVWGWDDCAEVPGKVVGRLAKQGKNWVLLPKDEVPSMDEVQDFFSDNNLVVPKTKGGSYSYGKHSFDIRCIVVAEFDANNNLVKGYMHPNGKLDVSKAKPISEHSLEAFSAQSAATTLDVTYSGARIVYLLSNGKQIVKSN